MTSQFCSQFGNAVITIPTPNIFLLGDTMSAFLPIAYFCRLWLFFPCLLVVLLMRSSKKFLSNLFKLFKFFYEVCFIIFQPDIDLHLEEDDSKVKEECETQITSSLQKYWRERLFDQIYKTRHIYFRSSLWSASQVWSLKPVSSLDLTVTVTTSVTSQ